MDMILGVLGGSGEKVGSGAQEVNQQESAKAQRSFSDLINSQTSSQLMNLNQQGADELNRRKANRQPTFSDLWGS